MGHGFVERFGARRDLTVGAVRDATTARVPGYGWMSAARHAALLDEVRDTWEPVLLRAAADEPFTEADLDVHRDLGRERALTRFPPSASCGPASTSPTPPACATASAPRNPVTPGARWRSPPGAPANSRAWCGR